MGTLRSIIVVLVALAGVTLFSNAGAQSGGLPGSEGETITNESIRMAPELRRQRLARERQARNDIIINGLIVLAAVGAAVLIARRSIKQWNLPENTAKRKARRIEWVAEQKIRQIDREKAKEAEMQEIDAAVERKRTARGV